MGFKDFTTFNIAMLAKQGWKILNNPEDLWIRMLKGIYFSNSSFLEAKKSARSSWAWSNLLEVKELLVKSLCWRVGSGRDI